MKGDRQNLVNVAKRLEDIQLRDGTPIVARALVPSDRRALADAYRRLSPAARFNRFWTRGGDEIGSKMLDRVLDEDFAIHTTWTILDPSREFPPMGAASWWRDDATSVQAEFSAVVLDGDQGRGIGTLLLAILWCLARHAGIRELVGYALTENRQAADWMRDTGAIGHWDGSQLIFRWDTEVTEPEINTRAAQDLTARIKEFEGRLYESSIR